MGPDRSAPIVQLGVSPVIGNAGRQGRIPASGNFLTATNFEAYSASVGAVVDDTAAGRPGDRGGTMRIQ